MSVERPQGTPKELQYAGVNLTKIREVAEKLLENDLSWTELVNSFGRGQSAEVRADLDGLELSKGIISSICQRLSVTSGAGS